MDQQTIRDIMSGRRGGFAAGVLRVGLSCASRPYAAAARLRRWAYRKGIANSHSAPVPVICVGNITTGGTGKTPMVVWVVEQLKSAGRSPAILTRGYKAVGGVSDEAELLKGLCRVPVVVNPDRVAGAAAAAHRGADVVVMDDGFGHLRLRRDLDIVLIDATNPFGFGRCLPRGLLREPLSALWDADAIVITRSDAVTGEQLERLRERLAGLAGAASLHAAAHRPVKFIDETGRDMPLDAIAGRKVCAFCGIGNPESFFEALEGLGGRLIGKVVLDDHAAYTGELVDSINADADSHDCSALVTTQKDYVKLGLLLPRRPIWQLAVEMDVVEGKAELIEKVLGVLR